MTTPARYTDMLLQIIQGYAPDGEAQEKVASMKRDMEATGCSDGFIIKSLAQTLVTGLSKDDWPWNSAARRQALGAAKVNHGKHDYEPGEYVAPMQTDPSCRACGCIKQDKVHQV